MRPEYGISGMKVYVPRLRVQLEDWCQWTGGTWGKVRSVVGESFRMKAPYESIYTMAANAVLRLLIDYDVDPARVGFLGFGTESSTDNSAGAVIPGQAADGVDPSEIEATLTKQVRSVIGAIATPRA